MGDLSAHFSRAEFRCKCGCGQVIVKPELVEALETIREHGGIPMTITSGYRCPAHNAAVGGAPDSAHTRGEAADFWVSGNRDRFKFIESIVWTDAVFRYGLGKDFIHVDVAKDKPSDVAWLYEAGE